LLEKAGLSNFQSETLLEKAGLSNFRSKKLLEKGGSTDFRSEDSQKFFINMVSIILFSPSSFLVSFQGTH